MYIPGILVLYAEASTAKGPRALYTLENEWYRGKILLLVRRHLCLRWGVQIARCQNWPGFAIFLDTPLADNGDFGRLKRPKSRSGRCPMSRARHQHKARGGRHPDRRI